MSDPPEQENLFKCEVTHFSHPLVFTKVEEYGDFDVAIHISILRKKFPRLQTCDVQVGDKIFVKEVKGRIEKGCLKLYVEEVHSRLAV